MNSLDRLYLQFLVSRVADIDAKLTAFKRRLASGWISNGLQVINGRMDDGNLF